MTRSVSLVTILIFMSKITLSWDTNYRRKIQVKQDGGEVGGV